MPGKVDTRLLSALQAREIEGLLLELGRVSVPHYRPPDLIEYEAKQLGLFNDRLLPPELEVVRVLRDLAAQRRLTIDRDELGGAKITLTMRSGQRLCVALQGGASGR